MKQKRRATIELALAVVLAACAVWAWFGAQSVDHGRADPAGRAADDVGGLQPADAGAGAAAGDGRGRAGRVAWRSPALRRKWASAGDVRMPRDMRLGEAGSQNLGTKCEICNTVPHDRAGGHPATPRRRPPAGPAVAGLALLRRQPDVPDRPAARGAAEHARRTRPGRAGPFGVLRRHRGPGQAVAAADLHDGVRRRRRQPGHRRSATSTTRSRATCPDGRALPRAGSGHVLLGARHVRRAGAVLRRHLRQAADPRRRRSRSTSSPRRGTAATASASGRCPPTTPRSSGTGTG